MLLIKNNVKADEVLADLGVMNYQAVADKHDTSRGKVYQLAVRHRSRKHEARLQERADASVQLHLTSIPYKCWKEIWG